MKKEPIEKFDYKTLAKSVAEWQEILQLNDWLIQVCLTDDVDDNSHGVCDMVYDNKTAVIKIQKTKEYSPFKRPDEIILVHELLHCKFPILYDEHDVDQVIRSKLQHQVLEEMAKALIMTKYKLKLDWFYN